jgi:WD40 repeat protein
MPEGQPRNLRVLRQINRRDILFSVARLPSSERLLLASSEGKVFDVDSSQANPTARALAEHGRYVTCVRLAGQTAISGGYDGRLIWWDLREGRVIRTVDAHSRWIRHIEFSPDGTKLASVGDDMVCRLWNVANGEKLHELRGHQERTPTHFLSALYVCAFSADGRYLATGDRIGHVVVWEVANGRQRAAMDAPILYTWDGVQRIRSIGGVRALAFSPDGRHLAIGGVGQIGNVDSLAGPSRVEIFDWERRERLLFFTGQSGIVNALRYHPQGRWLCGVGGGGNGLVLFYDPARRAMIHQMNAPMFAHDAVFNEDLSRLYMAGHNKIAVMEMRA